jgi:hypothetical protein
VNAIFCQEIKDLYDDSGNYYLRTVCVMKILVTQMEANSICLSYEMNLYKMDNNEAKKALLNFADTRFEARSGMKLHTSNSTECLFCHIQNGKGLFGVFQGHNDLKAYFYCQFIRKLPTLKPGKFKKKTIHIKYNESSMVKTFSKKLIKCKRLYGTFMIF